MFRRRRDNAEPIHEHDAEKELRVFADRDHGLELLAEADQEIQGEPMDKEIAHYLGRKPGEMAICALRRYTAARGTLIASLNWHVAEDFFFHIKLLKKL